MPFGLTSAPPSYQHLINHTLKPHKNTFILVYLDDIFTCSTSLNDHIRHNSFPACIPRHTLTTSQKVFSRNELEYLGHMISRNRQRPSDNEIKDVSKWQRPKKVQDSHRFLGFCNFYRRYVHCYSHVAAPIIYNTCRKNSKFQWTTREQVAFNVLKQSPCSSLVFHKPSHMSRR
jgi:hypothetical protein